MKPAGRAKIPSCRILDDHWLHHAMNAEKSNFNSYIYTLFLDFVHALFIHS